ncbi:transposase family protein [Streptomyces sp. Tue6028]|uniref:transposase family protein n=1 Tax=Streptomyces sp. Tue6028 TaxID=2036037 RepID=UPI003D73A558
MLVKLGPLDAGRVADLRPYLDSVTDPSSRRGRWYSLTAILLVCACAVVSGAKSIDELAGQPQTTNKIIKHPNCHATPALTDPSPWIGRSPLEPAARWHKVVKK